MKKWLLPLACAALLTTPAWAVELTVWVHPDFSPSAGLQSVADAYKAAYAEFEKENPDITIRYEVERGGIPIKLTAKEFELLRYLMQNPRRVLSRAQILDQVWSYDFGGTSSVVEIYISYLRKKIDTLGEPLIHTVRGVGYTIKTAS